MTTKLLALWALACGAAYAVTPDCSKTLQLTNDPTVQPNGTTIVSLSGAPAPPINNNLGGSSCQAWTFLYSFSGVLASSVEIDTASTSSGPFILFPGTINYGSNPYNSSKNGYTNLTGTYNYLKINVRYLFGIGTITVQAFGWINPANVGSIVNYPTSGGGSGTVGSGTTGQFGYYSSSGTAIVGHTLTFSDISGLFTGTPSSTTYARGDGTWATITATGTVTTFTAPSGSWPSWLVPTVTNASTTPNLAVAASTIPVSAGGTGTTTPSLVAGTNISITGSWPNQTITASGGSLTLTTSGITGAATYSGGTLNIPVYSAAAVSSLASGSDGALSLSASTGAITISGVTSVLSYQNNAETWGGAKTVNNIFTTELAVASTDATIASATTIAPTTSLVFVTGTTPIATITPSTGCTTSGIDCFLTLVADPSTGPFTFTTAGNIYATYTATVGQAVRLVYFPAKTKWYQIH